MKRRFVASWAGAVVLAASFSTLCLAQAPAGPKSRVTVVHVKPEMVNEFIDLLKNEGIPALKKGGAKSGAAYQTMLFGDAFEFRFVAPFDKYSEFDSQDPMVKGIGGEAAAQRFLAKLTKCLLSVNDYAIAQLPELSHGDLSRAPMLSVTRIRLSPDKRQQWIDLVKTEIIPATRKAQLAVEVNARMFGANGNDITVVAPIAKFAELDSVPAWVKAVGEDKMPKLGPKLSALETASEETIFLRRVPELSF